MKKYSRFQWYGVFLLAGLLVSCEVRRPDIVLSEDQMENLLYDYHMAQSLAENLPNNENYKRAIYTEAVFRKYNTSEAAFDSSMVWYTRNTEALSKIYEKVSKRLKVQQDEINHLIALRDKKPKMTLPGDSIDVWSSQRMELLTGMPLNNKLTFVIPSDSNFKKRDILLWEVRYRFLNGEPDKTREAVMAMQIVYENDSIISGMKKIHKSGIQRIRLQSDTLGLIKEVRGFIYYPEGKQLKTMLADKIALTRYRCTDSLVVAGKDSLQSDSLKTLKADSLKKGKTDSVALSIPQQRLRPEELNKPSNEIRQAKPEQIETEQRIQQEKQQMQQQRRTNRRTNSPAKR